MWITEGNRCHSADHKRTYVVREGHKKRVQGNVERGVI